MSCDIPICLKRISKRPFKNIVQISIYRYNLICNYLPKLVFNYVQINQQNFILKSQILQEMNIPINNQSTVPSGQLYPIINVDDRINNNRIILSLRNEIIQWLYRAQKYLHFSRSTLHLTVGVLDKIIVNNFKINKDNIELVSGSLLLICSKLNQKSYLSARRINSMLRKDNDHCSRDYIQTQALICQTLNYNILPENIIYQKLSELQVRCAKEKVHKCKQFVKIALMNVRSETESDAIVLLQAIEGLVSAGLFQNERRSDESNTQVQRIQTQLKRLHFMAHQ